MKTRNEMPKVLSLVALVALGVVTVGCGDVGDTSKVALGTRPTKAEMPKTSPAEAGVEAVVDTTPTSAPLEIAKRRSFGARGDAFALLPVERVFDQQQTSARLIAEGGGHPSYFAPTEEAVVAPVVTETLPLWRLSGVVIGDGVAALLDMGGRVIDIRPGMKIPDTDWVVASIDAEKAVLRREGNKLPHVFVVPLQGTNAPTGGGGTGGGKGGPAGGTTGGGGSATPGVGD
jgi:hypothetical protein